MEKYKLSQYIPNKVFCDLLFDTEPKGLVIKTDELKLHIKIENPKFLYEHGLIVGFNKSIDSEVQFNIEDFDFIYYEDGMIWFEDNVNEVAFFENKISLEFIISKLKTYGYIQ